MKIQISRTASSKLPKWADDIEANDYNRYITQGKILGVKIVVTAKSPNIAGTNWGGDWTVSPQVEKVIYLESRFVAQARQKNALWALSHCIKHELAEIEAAIVIARKKFPSSSPYVMANSVGGEAHLQACMDLDGMTETEYDRNLTLESTYLKGNLK